MCGSTSAPTAPWPGRQGPADGAEEPAALVGVGDVGVSMSRLYVSEWMFSIAIWKPIMRNLRNEGVRRNERWVARWMGTPKPPERRRPEIWAWGMKCRSSRSFSQSSRLEVEIEATALAAKAFCTFATAFGARRKRFLCKRELRSRGRSSPRVRCRRRRATPARARARTQMATRASAPAETRLREGARPVRTPAKRMRTSSHWAHWWLNANGGAHGGAEAAGTDAATTREFFAAAGRLAGRLVAGTACGAACSSSRSWPGWHAGPVLHSASQGNRGAWPPGLSTVSQGRWQKAHAAAQQPAWRRPFTCCCCTS